MIARYTREQLGRLWTDAARMHDPIAGTDAAMTLREMVAPESRRERHIAAGRSTLDRTTMGFAIGPQGHG